MRSLNNKIADERAFELRMLRIANVIYPTNAALEHQNWLLSFYCGSTTAEWKWGIKRA
jgi:hypothetical protein